MRTSPHFASTNTHSDFFAISKLSPIQSFNIIYAYVRLYNGSQVAKGARSEVVRTSGDQADRLLQPERPVLWPVPEGELLQQPRSLQ